MLDSSSKIDRQQIAEDGSQGEQSLTQSGSVMRTFGNGAGEIDMLMGFFIMNGACIGSFSFFQDVII